MLKQFIRIGGAGALLAMPVSIAAENPDSEAVGEMSNRLASTIEILESDASEEAIQRLADLIRRGQNAADEYSSERRKSKDAGAESENYELRKAAVEAIVAEINSHPPMDVDWLWLVTLYGWSSAEEVAEGWAIDFPDPIEDLEEDDIRILLDGVDKNVGTNKLDRFLWFLELSLGEAFSTDLIFYSYREWDNGELAKEIVKRRGVIEAGGKDALDVYELEVAKEVWANMDSKPWSLQWASSRLYPDDRPLRYEKLQERDRLAEEQSRAKQPD
ncbi:hypothetical protein [uncultured Erythrobacter sp.]|uniref:hypothetical protein n=1 Tax=uncultured Erythrobacter sp. TaxID=263913 RepID=UPI0026312350|nr:hypothetical protein [uncultured Erythrobacter sp.]